MKDENEIDGEIDFDYRVGKQQYLLQVAHTINENDYKREIENLRDLPSSVKKCVVYYINAIGKEESGIKYIQARDFFVS